MWIYLERLEEVSRQQFLGDRVDPVKQASSSGDSDHGFFDLPDGVVGGEVELDMPNIGHVAGRNDAIDHAGPSTAKAPAMAPCNSSGCPQSKRVAGQEPCLVESCGPLLHARAE